MTRPATLPTPEASLEARIKSSTSAPSPTPGAGGASAYVPLASIASRSARASSSSFATRDEHLLNPIALATDSGMSWSTHRETRSRPPNASRPRETLCAAGADASAKATKNTSALRDARKFEAPEPRRPSAGSRSASAARRHTASATSRSLGPFANEDVASPSPPPPPPSSPPSPEPAKNEPADPAVS